MPHGKGAPSADAGHQLPGVGAEGLAGFMGTRVEAGGAVDEGLEEEGHPGLEEKQERTTEA